MNSPDTRAANHKNPAPALARGMISILLAGLLAAIVIGVAVGIWIGGVTAPWIGILAGLGAAIVVIIVAGAIYYKSDFIRYLNIKRM